MLRKFYLSGISQYMKVHASYFRRQQDNVVIFFTHSHLYVTHTQGTTIHSQQTKATKCYMSHHGFLQLTQTPSTIFTNVMTTSSITTSTAATDTSTDFSFALLAIRISHQVPQRESTKYFAQNYYSPDVLPVGQQQKTSRHASSKQWICIVYECH